MMTISDIANRLGVTRAVAYGLVNLLQVKGVLSPTSKKQGSKGKPASLYLFNDAHVAATAEMVRALTAPQAETTTAEPIAVAV